MEDVITKNKEEFLQKEYEWYKHMYPIYKEYVIDFDDQAVFCKNCGVYYWNDLEMRCRCKILKEKSIKA